MNVVVVGGGYVGLPLAKLASLAGHEVVILDVDVERVKDINNKPVRATTDPVCQAEADVVLVCVPTPLTTQGLPDLTYLDSAVDSFFTHYSDGCLLSIESTVYPTYTETLWNQIEGDYLLCFSSERINPGTPFSELPSIPKVVGAVNEKSLEVAVGFYSSLFDDVVTVSSTTIAELSKLLENSFRAANIALINEFSTVCYTFKCDTEEVVAAASSKPFGFMPFHSGPGVGGHCIPVDPYYLLWMAKQKDCNLPFLEAAMETNRNRPSYVVSRVKEILTKGSILVVGVTYKEDVPDMRESPALEIINQLISAGYKVSYHDPLIPRLGWFNLKNVQLEDMFDLGIVVTGHQCIDLDKVIEQCTLTLDTRTVFPQGHKKVVRL